MNKNDLLLVIDMQNVYSKGAKWECRNTEEAARNVLNIISAGMENVIFTQFFGSENPYGVWKDYNRKYEDVNNDEWGNELLASLTETAAKFPVYSKSTYSSLTVPEVLAAAKKAQDNGGRVVVAGVVAECCVLATVFALIDEGVYTVYLTDAVSGLDVPKEKATELMFEGLSPLHVSMMTTREYLEEK